MKKVLLRIFYTALTLGILTTGSIYYYMASTPEFGGNIDGERQDRLLESEQYDHDHFHNTPPPIDYDIMVNLKDAMGDQVRQPPAPFPIEKPALSIEASQGLTAYWLGHATVLIELEGRRIITDPMLSDAAFPVGLIAPKRFNPPAITMEELPKIDIAVISHDHYDHLDMKTIQHLSKDGTHFFVGLGVGAHLDRWNIPTEQIHELDWWDSVEFAGLQVHCTPARHYSGRKSMSNATLWTSWTIKGDKHTIFHSGDTGYEEHFKEIGERLGPIDISFIKIGDYGLDLGWQDIHMKPENSIKAHMDLGAAVLFPIHWGTFQLSNHDWDEPIIRATAAAAKRNVTMVTPKLGEKVSLDEPFQNKQWWTNIVQ